MLCAPHLGLLLVDWMTGWIAGVLLLRMTLVMVLLVDDA